MQMRVQAWLRGIGLLDGTDAGPTDHCDGIVHRFLRCGPCTPHRPTLHQPLEVGRASTSGQRTPKGFPVRRQRHNALVMPERHLQVVATTCSGNQVNAGV